MPTTEQNPNGGSTNERGRRLHATADDQIGTLLGLLSTVDEATLGLPCPGREKLGNGTIATSAWHAADNYRRIAAFVTTGDRMSTERQPTRHGAHRVPRLLGAQRHETTDRADRRPGTAHPDGLYAADGFDLGAVIGQLAAARGTLCRLAELSDRQLDAVPPNDSFRFCDGQRTLEQVLAGLLKHQGHEVDAVKAAAS